MRWSFGIVLRLCFQVVRWGEAGIWGGHCSDTVFSGWVLFWHCVFRLSIVLTLCFQVEYVLTLVFSGGEVRRDAAAARQADLQGAGARVAVHSARRHRHVVLALRPARRLLLRARAQLLQVRCTSDRFSCTMTWKQVLCARTLSRNQSITHIGWKACKFPRKEKKKHIMFTLREAQTMGRFKRQTSLETRALNFPHLVPLKCEDIHFGVATSGLNWGAKTDVSTACCVPVGPECIWSGWELRLNKIHQFPDSNPHHTARCPPNSKKYLTTATIGLLSPLSVWTDSTTQNGTWRCVKLLFRHSANHPRTHFPASSEKATSIFASILERLSVGQFWESLLCRERFPALFEGYFLSPQFPLVALPKDRSPCQQSLWSRNEFAGNQW